VRVEPAHEPLGWADLLALPEDMRAEIRERKSLAISRQSASAGRKPHMFDRIPTSAD